MSIEVGDGRAVHVLRDLGQHALGEVHHVHVVGVGHVELEHGELGIVLRRDAFVAEVAVDLVHAVHAADYQALEVELGRDAQEQVHVERVVVGGEWLGDRASGDGVHHRRFDFDEGIGVEEAAQGLHDLGALDEDFAHVGVHGEIDVAAAVAGFNVLQAVPFFGQREKVLHQEGDFFDVDGEFAGTGAEEIALHADVVAEVEQLVEREAFFANVSRA